ncbi:VOC family protein [Solilutibacter silvestris]|uniref:VOC family protein n=1 Tax=Solilutibacter silvestris TaxID=1645665 RepID=UPI003D32CCBA
MSDKSQFKAAYPYQNDVLALPVLDIDQAAQWYATHFGMTESGRSQSPVPTVLMERNGTQIGFTVNGGDATQDGAAILVSDIHSMKQELDKNGVNTSDLRLEKQDGQDLQVFFVVAPDGLCYYFHAPL